LKVKIINNVSNRLGDAYFISSYLNSKSFAMDKNRAVLTPGLIKVGQLNVDDAGLKKILAQQ